MHPVLKDLLYIAVVLLGSGGLYCAIDRFLRHRAPRRSAARRVARPRR